MQVFSNPESTMRMLLRVASSIDTMEPSGGTIVPVGAVVDGKPTEFRLEDHEKGPVDGSARFQDGTEERTSKEEPSDAGPKPTYSPDTTPDKKYEPTSWVKPPRREDFNESATRGWRNDYQREYRAEHGNNA